MKLKKFGLVLLFPMMLASCGGNTSSVAPATSSSAENTSTETSSTEQTSTSAEETCFIKEDTTISVWSSY